MDIDTTGTVRTYSTAVRTYTAYTVYLRSRAQQKRLPYRSGTLHQSGKKNISTTIIWGPDIGLMSYGVLYTMVCHYGVITKWGAQEDILGNPSTQFLCACTIYITSKHHHNDKHQQQNPTIDWERGQQQAIQNIWIATGHASWGLLYCPDCS